MGLVSNKNFITTNAVEAILSQPKQIPELEFWTQKKGYGKTPKYLATAKQTIEKEKEAVEAYRRMKEQEEMPSSLTQMDESERRQLLAHLKTKWDSVNTAYQKMTFTLDTPAKQKRKEGYEKQLVEIERDIQMLERGDVVLVVDE
ncbi:hypothetical protein BSKO_01549 [Bryopsis sp. KO-2023]|nr:hypothetical protein BSKO_01549 [Bryopsis sp. KO-2023]